VGQFGLDHTTAAIERLAPGQAFAIKPMLLVDELREQPAGDAIWPYLCLREPVWPVVHSDIARVPPPGSAPCRDAAGTHIVVAETNRSDDLEPTVDQMILWQIDGATLPAMDPIHLLEFRHSLGTGIFVPHGFGRDASGRPLVTAGRWRGDGHDLYLPIMELEWKLASEALPQLCLEVGAARGVALVEFDAPAKVTCRFVTFFGIWRRDAHLADRCSLRGDAFLHLAQSQAPLDTAHLERALTGEWASVHKSFCPALTAAMNYAFDHAWRFAVLRASADVHA